MPRTNHGVGTRPAQTTRAEALWRGNGQCVLSRIHVQAIWRTGHQAHQARKLPSYTCACYGRFLSHINRAGAGLPSESVPERRGGRSWKNPGYRIPLHGEATHMQQAEILEAKRLLRMGDPMRARVRSHCRVPDKPFQGAALTYCSAGAPCQISERPSPSLPTFLLFPL